MTTTAATRVSTLAKVLDDASGLHAFMAATTLESIVAHRDLLDRLPLTTGGDWRAFKPLHEEAQARRGKPEAGAGTNIHRVAEMLANGEDASLVEPGLLRDAQAVMAALERHGLEPVRTEEFVVTLGLPEVVAGTRDLLVRHRDTGLHYVADIKSTSRLGASAYRAVSWAVQLACYAHGEVYGPQGDEVTRDRWGRPLVDLDLLSGNMVEASHSRGYVVEVERGAARTQVHAVNLRSGWAWADLACQVRAARKDRTVLVTL